MDVVGSTEMGERLDPESTRRVMSRLFEAVRPVLEHHGGTVEKFIGDAVMAVFGIPAVHEDDALRACRAALQIQGEINRLNKELERDWGMTISTRTGINTGEVIAGDPSSGQTLVTGDPVNTAARLEQSAPPGSILIGTPAYRLVADAVDVEPVEPVTAKGKADAVAAYRLVSVAPLVSQRVPRLDSPMVGRERELAMLLEAFDRSVAEGRCVLATVLGMPGVGKSRLAHEFVASTADRAMVLRGRCLPYGEGITFWPVVNVVHEAAGITEGDSPEEARARIEALLPEAEDRSVVRDRVAAAIGLGEATWSIQETFWAIRKLLESVASDRPLAVVFDDIHWAEPAFLDLVEYLEGWCRSSAILIVCIARPELLETRVAWASAATEPAMTALNPLNDEESDRLIQNLLGPSSVPNAFRRRIAQTAEGNPLFVEEMLGMLIDEDRLRREDGLWVTTDESSSVPTPSSIQSLLAARIEQLPETERSILQRASIVGKSFWWGAVVDLSPLGERPRIGPRLQDLVRKGMIRPEQSTLAGQDAFRFRHILIRDAAYHSLPKAVRAELHERLAGWIEATAGDRIGENEEILAYHLEQAARYRVELGRPDASTDDLIDRASAALAGVGRRAGGRGDISAARSLLGRASELLPDDDPRRLALVPELGQALMETGELARAERMLGDALDRAGESGDRGLEAHVQIVALLLKEFTEPEHRSEEALETLGSVIPVLEELGDDLGLARAYRLMGDVHFARSSYANADRAFEQAIERARKAGAEYEEAESLRLYAGSGLYGPAPADEVMKRCEQIMEVARGNPMAEAGAIRSMGVLNAMRGRIDQGRELVRESAQVLEDNGLTLRATFVSEAIGFIETLAGDHAAAERALRAAHDEVSRLGELGYQATAAALLAHAICAQERFDEAEEYCRIAREVGAEDDFATQVLWRSAQAKVLAARGQHAEAADLARAAVELAEDTDDTNMCADSLMDLAQVLAAVGDSAERADVLRRAAALYERKGNVVSADLARRSEGAAG
jgi:class 3 adenylate cyclase/tetratricopeptide (TPR) repeat protein